MGPLLWSRRSPSGSHGWSEKTGILPHCSAGSNRWPVTWPRPSRPSRSGRTDGSDPSGTVTVRLDADGQFDGVTVANNWRDKVEPSELGAALLTAFQQAHVVRLTRWAEALPDPAAEPTPPPPRSNPFGLPTLHDPPPAEKVERFDREQVMGDLLGALDGLTAVAPARTADQAPVSGADQRGHVTVTVGSDGMPSAVDVDAAWATGAPLAQLIRTIEEAFSAAARRVPGGDSSMADLPRLAQLAGTDPAAFLQAVQYGLDTPGAPRRDRRS